MYIQIITTQHIGVLDRSTRTFIRLHERNDVYSGFRFSLAGAGCIKLLITFYSLFCS